MMISTLKGVKSSVPFKDIGHVRIFMSNNQKKYHNFIDDILSCSTNKTHKPSIDFITNENNKMCVTRSACVNTINKLYCYD